MTATLQPTAHTLGYGTERHNTEREIALVDEHAAHNYAPMPVVAASAEGAWITDVEGRRYLDCLAAYSAVNFGHRNAELTAVAHAQLEVERRVGLPGDDDAHGRGVGGGIGGTDITRTDHGREAQLPLALGQPREL